MKNIEAITAQARVNVRYRGKSYKAGADITVEAADLDALVDAGVLEAEVVSAEEAKRLEAEEAARLAEEAAAIAQAETAAEADAKTKGKK